MAPLTLTSLSVFPCCFYLCGTLASMWETLAAGCGREAFVLWDFSNSCIGEVRVRNLSCKCLCCMPENVVRTQSIWSEHSAGTSRSLMDASSKIRRNTCPISRNDHHYEPPFIEISNTPQSILLSLPLVDRMRERDDTEHRRRGFDYRQRRSYDASTLTQFRYYEISTTA